MKRRGHAKRRDANEPEIVAALEDIGCTVIRLDPFDLLVGRGGVTMLVEVKNPERMNGARDPRTAAQKEIERTWKGSPLRYVETVAEAVRVVNEATGRGRA